MSVDPTPSTPEQAAEERLGAAVVRLKPGLRISRVKLGGKPFYVLRDPCTGNAHKVPPDEYQVIVRASRGQTLADAFDACLSAGLVTSVDRSGFYAFVAHLSVLGLVLMPSVDGRVLHRRAKENRAREERGRWLNFLFLRVPLVSPDAFLEKTMHLVRGLFSRTAMWVWLAFAALTMTVAVGRWSDLVTPLLDLLELHNLPWLAVTMIVLKIVHELGHGYACKHFGGEVPEMGIIFIVGTPCAYVDATAAWNFPSKAHRILVSLAGMYIESICAFAALWIWALTPPGLFNTIAYQTFILASVTTVLFNINPLMKFDGYFVLGDLVGVPNLRQTSHTELRGFFDRWILGLPRRPSPLSSGARAGLASFGIASAIYKIVLVLSISMMVALKIPMLGLLLAGYYTLSTLVGFARSTLRYLCFDPTTAPVRLRAGMLCAVTLVGVPALLLLVPVALPEYAPGVVHSESETVIRARSPGFLDAVLAQPGDSVVAGTLIAQLQNHDLLDSQREAEIDSRLAERERAAAGFYDRQLAERLASRDEILARRVRRTREDAAALVVVAPRAGRVVQCLPSEVTGHFVEVGDELALIASGPKCATVALHDQAFNDLALRPGAEVKVRASVEPFRTIRATVERLPSHGARTIADRATTNLGGGPILVDPETQEAAAPHFRIRLRLDADASAHLRHGMRVTAQFPGARRPLLSHLYRSLLRFVDSVRQG